MKSNTGPKKLGVYGTVPSFAWRLCNRDTLSLYTKIANTMSVNWPINDYNEFVFSVLKKRSKQKGQKRSRALPMHSLCI